MDNLIPKDALLDAVEDDDDIEWNTDPFEYPDRVKRESPEALIQFAGPPALQEALRALCLEYSDIFATSVRHLPAKVQAIRSQIDSLLASHRGIAILLLESAPYGQEAHTRRMAHDPELRPVQCCDTGLEGWLIPNIQQTLARLSTLKPKLFGHLDFTAGNYLTPLHPASRACTAFSAAKTLPMD
jgi:hypothetical protein